MEHFEDEIDEFLDGELNSSTQRELFLHLSQCKHCMRLFEDGQKLHESLKRYYTKLELQDKLTTTATVQKRPLWPEIMTRYSWAGFSIALLLLFVLLVQQQNVNNKNTEIQKLQADIAALKIRTIEKPVRVFNPVEIIPVKKTIRRTNSIPSNQQVQGKDSIRFYLKDINNTRFVTVDKNDFLVSYNNGR